jgi:hypothetical protein
LQTQQNWQNWQNWQNQQNWPAELVELSKKCSGVKPLRKKTASDFEKTHYYEVLTMMIMLLFADVLMWMYKLSISKRSVLKKFIYLSQPTRI